MGRVDGGAKLVIVFNGAFCVISVLLLTNLLSLPPAGFIILNSLW